MGCRIGLEGCEMQMKRLLALIVALLMSFCAVAAAEEELEDVIDEELPQDVYDEAYDDADKGSISVDDYGLTEDLPDEWWNILLLGTDDRGELGDNYSRTDSMIILSVNPATKEAKLTSLMRDTWVPIEGRKSRAKLNAASVYGGPELTMRTINKNFGMNISDYVLINLSGLADVIDALGGLDLDVTEAERKALNKGLFDLSLTSVSGMEKLEESGENVHLNGNQAVAFARIRKIDTDYRRTERQRTVLMAIASKLKEQNNIGTLASVVQSFMPYVVTNLDIASELLPLALVGLQMDMDSVEQFRIPADGTFKDGMYEGVWCIRPDFEKNTELLHEFIYGE